MSEIKKTYRQLQIIYSIFFAIGIIVFVVLTLINLKQILHGGDANPVLERYAIGITLIGIPLSLKIYHYLMKKITNQRREKKMRFYNKIYIIRLGILEFVLACNAIGLYITGVRNFFYMIFITIIAFLFCLPNKMEFETLCDNENDVPIE